MLKITNLKAKVNGKEILKGINLEIDKGLYFLMGPNGAGKSTLARALSGDPSLEVNGEITLDNKKISELGPEDRFKLGLFMGYQIPPEIKGVKARTLLEKALEKHGKRVDLDELAKMVGLSPGILERDVNVGFSGGERKKLELLQLLAFKPRYAILDEPDSGVDMDTLRKLGGVLNSCKDACGILVITHTGNLLKFTEPKKVFILANGRIVSEGGPELVSDIEERGYSMVIE